MYLWISALLGALLSLGVPGVSPDTLVGTARVSGPVFLNGTKVNQQVVITDGDRLVTGPGGIASLNLSSTDRLILGEGTTVRLLAAAKGVTAEVEIGRLQVNASHQRLHEVRLTDEGISISATPGTPRDYMVTRMANASYVVARSGSVTVVDEGYGSTTEVPEGKVGAIRTELAHLDPPLPQQRTTPVSTTTGGRAGHVTALIPEDFIVRGGSPTPAAKGIDVNFHDVVKSSPSGRLRMVLDDGSILNLGSASEMTVTESNKQTGRTTVELAAGRVRAQVVKLTNPQGEWQVRTNTAICGVLGTDFDVQVTPEKTILTVFKGKVRFTPLGRGVTSAAISAVTVVAGQTSTAAAGAVAAPVSSGVSSASSAVASTAISSQGASAAGNVAIAASRVGVVTGAAVPAAAVGSVVVGATVANSADGGTSNTSNIATTSTGVTTVSQSHP